MFTPAALHKHLPSDASRLWVGFSGGLDSVVLLHALVQLKLPVTAIHVNHQISPNALHWQQHCAELCAGWGVDFIAEAVRVEPAGKGLEDAARSARYAVFQKYVAEGDCLLTAHHADDQAETLLLRLLRGSGPRGLAAMARQRPLGKARLIRPLLDVRRKELEAYAIAHQLRWVDDESNLDTRYDRNYLRQEVMPLLAARWPDYTRRWQQSAQACAESEHLLEELAAEDLARALPRPERQGWSLALPILRELSAPRRHNLFRYWFRQHHFAAPEAIHLQHIDTQLIFGRRDAEGEVRWGEVVVQDFRERLYIRPSAAPGASESTDVSVWQLSGKTCECILSPGTSLEFKYGTAAAGADYLRADINSVELRWRRGGERCRPVGRAHSQTLKKLLQEQGLEPWWRECLPLVYVEDQLAAVGDLWICAGFEATPGEPGYRLHWHIR
ncbi:MAG: tRNA lysidine(34) synthetase TilS [Cellvibrio sp.]|jgi:tRNA(Ile)-lysidine synthetase, N-terminal domain/tRNA(Ile)-lysidine synthetase, C-terminal domain